MFIAKLGHSTSDYVTNSGKINIFFFFSFGKHILLKTK